jgi:hypothetical protein
MVELPTGTVTFLFTDIEGVDAAAEAVRSPVPTPLLAPGRRTSRARLSDATRGRRRRRVFEELDRAGLSTIQAGDVGFGTSSPSTAELVQSFVGFLEPLSRGPDPAVERAIRRALRLQETDAIAANEVWGRVDRLLVDRAFLVPLFNERSVHVISERAGNHQVHPYWDVLLDQMWVR